MVTEILEYCYFTDWNIEKLKALSFRNIIEPDFPLIVSSMSSYKESSLSTTFRSFLENKKRNSPKTILDSWPGGFNRRISEYLGTTSETMLVTANCASGIYCLYLADLISKDKNKPVVVVCADNVMDPFDLWRFDNIGAMDQNGGLPFDTSSKGFRMGTGIVLFLVKNSSVKFNIDAKAVINQFAFWTNNSFTDPGSSDQIIANLQRIDYSVFDLWNAHAPGTPLGDRIEYEYFSKVIHRNIPIVSYKGHIGHCMTASGAVEIAMSLEGREQNTLLPNIIRENKIVDDDRIITAKTSFPYRRMFKTTLGFGGKIAVADISFV